MAWWLRSVLFAVSLLFAIPLTPAFAIPITVSFTVTGFLAGAPTDPVTASVVYDAASTTSNINSLTSIDLTIAGHSYSPAEVGFVEGFPDNTVIGGLVNGIGAVGANTDDFVINWDTSTLHPVIFAYSCATCDVVYFGFTFTQFNVTAASAVPEPSSLTTLLTGILGFCVFLNLVRCRTTTRVSPVT
jgi:hypothetical protein